MAATVDQLMTQLNAEDFEKEFLELCLKQANAYVRRFINRDDVDKLDEDAQDIFDRIVLEVASNFYLNRDGSAKGVNRSYSGLNYLVDSLRNPSFGVSDE